MNLLNFKYVYLGRVGLLFMPFLVLLILPPLPAKAQDFEFEKYCSKDANIASIYVAIDVTTPYDEKDRKGLNKMLSHVIREQKGGNHVLINLVRSHQMDSKVVFEGCVPACLKTGIEKWTGCSEGLIATDKKRYLRDMVKSLKEHIRSNSGAKNSALVFTLEGLLKKIATDGKRISRLYIYSDMIENSKEIPGKVFWSKSPEKILRMAKRKFGYKPRKMDKEVDIYIYGFGRAGEGDRKYLSRKQIIHVQKFWNRYFQGWGISEDRIHWVTY